MPSIAPYLVLASEAEGEPAVSVLQVGMIVFVILLALLLVTIAIGGGRDHS